MAGTRTPGHGHSGATAITGTPHRVSRALRAVRIFAGVAVGVVLLGDYAEEWKEDLRPSDDPGRNHHPQRGTTPGKIPAPKDWRHERDAWASGRMSGDH